MNVFAYGSLMFDAVWSRVVRGRYAKTSAVLGNHVRGRVRDRSYPGLVVGEGRVEGVVYSGVDADDLARLDAFEGAEYERVLVTTDDGLVAHAYRLVDATALDGEWSRDRFDAEHFFAKERA